jgi:hypothetical protein
MEIFKIFGYFKYAPEAEVDKLLAMNKEVMELSESLENYNKHFEEFLKVKSQSLFSKFDFQLVVYDEIEKFRNYDDPMFGYPYDDRKIQVNSFTLNPTYFQIEEVSSHLLYEKVPDNYLYTSQQVNFKKSYVCLESHFAEVLV